MSVKRVKYRALHLYWAEYASNKYIKKTHLFTLNAIYQVHTCIRGVV